MKTGLSILFTFLGIFCLVIAHAQTSKSVSANNKGVLTIPQVNALTVIEKNRNVSLSWSTTGEQSSTHFIIERSSDGLQFDSVGAVTALGRFQLSTSYEFIDLQPLPATKFYRIRIVDQDGTRDYGRIAGIESVRKIPVSSRNAVAKGR